VSDTLQTVLIIDDNVDLTDLLQMALPRYWPAPPLIVLTAASLEAARAVLAQESVDLVVLDLLLPGGNGLTAVHHLLHDMQTLLGRLLPVVVMSGYLSDVIEGAALRAGMQACVAKGEPHLAPRLVQAMREAWQRHQYIEERLRLVREARPADQDSPSQGEPGEPGEKGDKGDKGEKGDKGDKGDTGDLAGGLGG